MVVGAVREELCHCSMCLCMYAGVCCRAGIRCDVQQESEDEVREVERRQ